MRFKGFSQTRRAGQRKDKTQPASRLAVMLILGAAYFRFNTAQKQLALSFTRTQLTLETEFCAVALPFFQRVCAIVIFPRSELS